MSTLRYSTVQCNAILPEFDTSALQSTTPVPLLEKKKKKKHQSLAFSDFCPSAVTPSLLHVRHSLPRPFLQTYESFNSRNNCISSHLPQTDFLIRTPNRSSRLISLSSDTHHVAASHFRPQLHSIGTAFKFVQANGAFLTEEDKVKAETERAKAPVDFTTLQLHNLIIRFLCMRRVIMLKLLKLVEISNLKYPDIELVPEEEFFRDAPEAIKDQWVSSDSSHVLLHKRINFELHQRKELCKHQVRLDQQKKSLLKTIAERKKFLSSLPLHLKSLKKASLPVQNQLGMQHTKKLKQHNLAELLLPSLYVIFSQLLAQKEAFEESIDLEIVGSLKDAQAYARQQSKNDSGVYSSFWKVPCHMGSMVHWTSR